MGRSSWWEVACGEESAGVVPGVNLSPTPGAWRKHLVFPTLAAHEGLDRQEGGLGSDGL